MERGFRPRTTTYTGRGDMDWLMASEIVAGLFAARMLYLTWWKR